MKDVVKFFWQRTQRAWGMDAANKLQGKPTHYWIEASVWTDEFKKTLSNKDLKTFEHEWLKLDAELDLAQQLADGQKEGYAKKLVAKNMNDDPEFMLNRATLGYIKP
jgi:hypothetical protein